MGLVLQNTAFQTAVMQTSNRSSMVMGFILEIPRFVCQLRFPLQDSFFLLILRSVEPFFSATHAGVIQDAYGGDVTIVKQAGQDAYKHSYKNGVLSYEKPDGYGVSFSFSEPTFNCPKGTKEFADNCYAFYANMMTWSKADEECKNSWNGHLASIGHNNEQARISNSNLLHKKNYWSLI